MNKYMQPIVANEIMIKMAVSFIITLSWLIFFLDFSQRSKTGS